MKTFEPDPHGTYPIQAVVRMTGSSRRKIVFYCRKGLVSPVEEVEDEWYFDEESVMRLRHVETLRQVHGMNWAAISTIMELLREVEALRSELRFRR